MITDSLEGTARKTDRQFDQPSMSSRKVMMNQNDAAMHYHAATGGSRHVT